MGNLDNYLKTFGISYGRITIITEAATNNLPIPLYPDTCQDKNALAKCHFAGMHMLSHGPILF